MAAAVEAVWKRYPARRTRLICKAPNPPTIAESRLSLPQIKDLDVECPSPHEMCRFSVAVGQVTTFGCKAIRHDFYRVVHG